MMFIDSDIGFDPRDVLAMLALQSDDSEYDVLAGPYPKKCISWEKIKLAVDKGVADEDPNVLERFVGDYVFNPKGGGGNIRIDQPVEVMEVGTGFMMTRRSAFAKFEKAFPSTAISPTMFGPRPLMALARSCSTSRLRSILSPSVTCRKTTGSARR